VAYERPVALYTLEFDEFPGLHITVRGMTGATMIELAGLNVSIDQLQVDPTPAVPLFVSMIDSWDLQRAGLTLPVTFDAFLSHDVEFIKTVTRAWVRDIVLAPYPVPEPQSIVAELPEVEGPDLSELESFARAA
jgi:hypothetical protein